LERVSYLGKYTNMKKMAYIFLLMALSFMAVSSVMGQDSQMACPGHDGSTIASLRLCVTHAIAEGHITNQGVVKSLLAKLDAAHAALDRGQVTVAVNSLRSFINEVQAQAGKHIHAEHAMHMIEHAQQVIVALGG
jgi:hypothetical protein